MANANSTAIGILERTHLPSFSHREKKTMEAAIALIILLFGLSAYGPGAQEEMEMEMEEPMQEQEMVMKEEPMGKM